MHLFLDRFEQLINEEVIESICLDFKDLIVYFSYSCKFSLCDVEANQVNVEKINLILLEKPQYFIPRNDLNSLDNHILLHFEQLTRFGHHNITVSDISVIVSSQIIIGCQFHGLPSNTFEKSWVKC